MYVCMVGIDIDVGCVRYDATVAVHIGSECIRSGTAGCTVPAHCIAGSGLGVAIVHWLADPAILAACQCIVRTYTERFLHTADPVHCDLCHSHESLLVPTVLVENRPGGHIATVEWIRARISAGDWFQAAKR